MKFDEMLRFYMSSFKGYNAKQKRCIFRRRPPKFIKRWKKLYPKWYRHQVLHLRRGCMLQQELMRRDYFWNNIKKDTTWTGRRVTFPVYEKGE